MLARLRTRLLLSAALTIATPAWAPAWADDFYINSPFAVTNGGGTIDGNDSLTITSTGSITPPAGNYGVLATGSNNSFDISGSIETDGMSAHAMQLGSGNIIDMSGRIRTNAGFAHGFNVVDDNTIDVSGYVFIRDDDAFGINMRNGNTVNLSGAIRAQGAYGAGINAGSDNGITVSGMIITTSNGNGISAQSNNTISMSGQIYGLAWRYQNGIKVYNNNKLNVSGSISLNRAERSAGIFGNDENTVELSGSVTTGADAAVGIAMRNRNTIGVSGAINTAGSKSHGIRLNAYNAVDMSGVITTTGNGAQGVDMLNGNTVEISGDVNTAGYKALGVYAKDRNAIVLSGAIGTAGDKSGAIYAYRGNTISSSGSIATKGFAADAIYAYDGNSVTNSGLITTEGKNSNGISIRSNNNVINSGSIILSGNSFSNGIHAEYTGNNILNSGTISVAGERASGIMGGSSNSIENSGAIRTTGQKASGIYLENDSQLSVSGTIQTTGSLSRGIYAGAGNSIVVSGSVVTEGANSFGIYVERNNFVAVTGSVRSTGAMAFGVAIGEYSSLVVSGSVYSSIFGVAAESSLVAISGSVIGQRGSILLGGAPSTLVLKAPAFLGGSIFLGQDTNLFVQTGKSHSILWDFSSDGSIYGGAPVISGPVPWFYNNATKQVATFDPTAFAAAPDVLADITGDIAGLIRARLGGVGASLANSSLLSSFADAPVAAGSARIDQAFDEGSSSSQGIVGGQWWISGFGSDSRHDGDAMTLDRNFTESGVAIGYDAAISPDLAAGMLAGWSSGSFKANSPFATSYDNESEGFFAAVYGRKQQGAFFANLALSGGLLDHSDSRFVNDNQAQLGNSHAGAQYNSWWLAPEIGVGVDIAGKDGWTLTPSGYLRYAMQSIEGYSETGSAANAKVEGRTVAILEGRLQIAAMRTVAFGEFGWRAGWQYRTSVGDDGAGVSMIGQSVNVSAATADRSSGFAGAVAKFTLSPNSQLVLDGEAALGEESESLRGTASLVARF